MTYTSELYNKDCLEYMKTIPDEYFDLIVTDPPYDVALYHEGGSLNNPKKRWKESIKEIIDTGLD